MIPCDSFQEEYRNPFAEVSIYEEETWGFLGGKMQKLEIPKGDVHELTKQAILPS